jgi:ribonuclease PH
VNVTVLEYTGKWSLLALATNAVSAAIAESGIDVLDLVSASSFAVTPEGMVIDPSGEEEEAATAGGVLGYMASTKEVTDLWITGGLEMEEEGDMEVDSAHATVGGTLLRLVTAADDARLVVNHALMEMVKEKGLALDKSQT